MNISKGLKRVFEDAQLIAQRYSSDLLETWHVLLAFVINQDTVAGAVLADYPPSVADYEHATFVVTEKSLSGGHRVLQDFAVVQAFG